MKNLRIVYSLFLLLFGQNLLAIQANPEDGTKLTKTLNRSFKVGSNAHLNLSNKYGQMLVSTWQKDSIKVEIEISAYGNDTKTAESLLERVDVEFAGAMDFVKIETVLDKNKDIFDEIWNKITDYSKAVLSENNLKINYTVFIPETTSVELNNKFGDVYLDKILKKSTISVSYGDLRANELGNTVLDLRYGSATIKNIQDATLRLQIAEADILKSKKINLESHSSTVYFADADELKINSRNDRLRIDEVNYLNGTTSFSKVRIESLSSELALFMSYGELEMNKVKKNFESVRIDSKSTDLSLRFDKEAYYEVETIEAVAEDKKSANFLDMAQGLTGNKNSFSANRQSSSKKIYGKAEGKMGKVVINAQKGEVRILQN